MSDPPRLGAPLALVCAGAFMSTLDITIVIVAFNDIRESFPSVGQAQLSWIITIYTIMSAAMLVPSGRLADRVGAHRTFIAGNALFALGSLGAGLAPSVALLIAARVVQGVGSAVQTPSALSLIAKTVPDGKRSMAIGLWGATSGLGSAIAPSIGALIVDNAGWRWVFLINVPVGVAIIVASARLLRHVPPQPALTADWIGAATIAAGVGLLTLALVQSDEWGWADVRTLGALIGGVALIVTLVVRAQRDPRSILDLTLFHIPSFRWATLVAISLPIGFFLQFFGSVQFLTKVWGYSELRAGFLLTPLSVVQASLTLVAGRIADRFGHRRAMVPGGISYVAGALIWWFGLTDARELWLFYLGALFLGIGVGLTYACFNSAAVHHVDAARVGLGSGLNNTVNRIGASLGIALAVALLAGESSATAFARLWMVMAVCGLFTAAFAAKIDTRPRVIR